MESTAPPVCEYCGRVLSEIGYEEYLTDHFESTAEWDGEARCWIKGDDWQMGTWNGDIRVVQVRTFCPNCGVSLGNTADSEIVDWHQTPMPVTPVSQAVVEYYEKEPA